MAPKDKIFKKYIEIELQLGNVTRCRTLYEKYLEWAPANCYTWCKYAEFERTLNETERARAIAQPALDTPELLWKAYIDFEIAEGEFDKTRQLYDRLLDRTKHLKVWISYAKFEASAGIEEAMNNEVQEKNDDNEERERQRIERCRGVFERAFDYFRTNVPELKEERAMLLEEWFNLESSFGNLGDISLVQSKLPRKVKRKRPIILSQDETPATFEEYIDYIFPDEVALVPNMKLLEAAYKWKKQKITA